MTALNRVRTRLTGFPGGPGVATMYTLDTSTFISDLHDFWSSMSGIMPPDVNIQVENSGDVIDEATGEITGAWAASPVALVTGSSGATYAAPCGMVVTWLTATYVHGRRLKGRTFVVPISGGNYQSDGSLVPGTVTAVDGYSTAFELGTTPAFVVWSRPFAGRAASAGVTAIPARAGSHGAVTGHRVPDRVAILRSRRD